MDNLTIAAAQFTAAAGDIDTNLARHAVFLQAAAEHGVRYLVFPELSLTGYELQLGRQLAMGPREPRLLPLLADAQRLGITAVVGAPVRFDGEGDVYIGAFTLGPAGLRVHTKQHLHPGEDAVFAAGESGPAEIVDGIPVALAICADFSQASHAASAAQAGARLYAASALITDNGYAHDTALLARYAADHDMAVLMANHGGATGGWTPAGRSAVWAEGGARVIAAAGDGDALVMAMRGTGGWSGAVVPVGTKQARG